MPNLTVTFDLNLLESVEPDLDHIQEYLHRLVTNHVPHAFELANPRNVRLEPTYHEKFGRFIE